MPALLPSELPVRARTRHHWIVLLRLPSRVLAIALLVLLLIAIVSPNPMALVFALTLGAVMFFRWHTWRAEWIILTTQRIIRVQGVPETTSSEASLRLDRISGARIVQTVPGKILGYGNIELEAPGEHPDVRRLKRIAHPQAFYLELRREVFGDGVGPDPDDEPPHEHITEPLPFLPNERDRFGRRQHWHNDY
jgi:hypothetical protein